MKKTERKSRGFTLVELLIVISIIALLSAILLPGLSRAREYAYFTACKSHQRQIGIAFLTFTSDNRGKMPEGRYQCWGGNGLRAGRRIGNKGEWLNENAGGTNLLADIYMDPGDFVTWFGGGHAHVSYKPRDPGKYLPIEILWDSIVKVRNWGPWGKNGPITKPRNHVGLHPTDSTSVPIYAGYECTRDWLSRNNGTYTGGKFGYEFFVHTVGCTQADNTPPNREHVLQNYGGTGNYAKCEEPFRPATKSSNMSAWHKPSAWVAACLVPVGEVNIQYNYRSHFGVRNTPPSTFRFNVLHLDGHVDDDAWKLVEVPNGTGWNRGKYSSAYGWSWESDTNSGWKDEADFSGAFDTNK